jgi:phosphoserine phosphatase
MQPNLQIDPSLSIALEPATLSPSPAASTIARLNTPFSHPTATQAKTRVILVRHGRSTFNEQGRYQGSNNEAVLTEKGKAAARQTAMALKDIPIDAIYTSPLARARQTLDEMIAVMEERSTSSSIQFSNQLREIDLPTWEGLSFQQVREQFEEDYRCWKQRPHELQMYDPNLSLSCAPVLDLYQRAQNFWQTILPHHIGQTLLIMSHGGTNHALISTALGLTAEHHHTIQQSNCGISVLEFSGGKRLAQLRAINLTDHLGETLPKLKEGKKGLRILLVPCSENINHSETIATALKDVPIDFSISIASESVQQAIDPILQHHPKAVQLQTHRDDFVQTWWRSIAHHRQFHSEVMTGLIVASPEMLQSSLAQVLEHRRIHFTYANPLTESFHLQPGRFSVLHYPSNEHPPILQTLNFGENVATVMTPPS